MPTNQLPAGDGSAQPPHQDAALDRQMLRHLLSKYTNEELSRLVREVQTNGAPSDTASIVTSSASTVISDAPSSVWDSTSIRSFSDASSITGSIISNVTSKTSKLLKRSQTSSQAIQAATEEALQAQTQQESEWSEPDPLAAAPSAASQSAQSVDSASAAAAAMPKKPGAFMCGFCKEEGMTKTCTRKNDLKRHIEDFHNVDAQWHCHHRGCSMVFDWQAAYKLHLKNSHGGSRMSVDEAKVNLCPQVVFACGFENCVQVYEASGDSDAPATFKEYVAHVVKHFDEGTNSGDWSYAARIRNLLRQSQVNQAWGEAMGWNESHRNQFQWQPQSSGILRKRLECRHIGNPKALVQLAYILGTDPSRLSKLPDDFVTPMYDTCTMSMPGHKVRQQRPATAMPAPMPAPDDPFQFKISRGTNPALAAYIASQKRVYVPRPGHRSAPRPHQLQSTRPAMPTAPTSNPMNPTAYFTSLPEPAHGPASPLYGPTAPHQPFSSANSIMPHGGIIADDLESLRSMAVATGVKPDPDIDMTDPNMIGLAFGGSPYHSGMHTPPPTDAMGSPASMHPDYYEPHAY